MAMLEIQGVTKIIKRNMIIDDISVSFSSGRVYGLKGINGCGKTMMMRLISGLIKPTKGKITIQGKQLWKDINFPESIGILIENPSFLDDYSGLENLKILAGLKNKIDEQTIRDIITEVGLNPDDKKKYKKYSLGMKQRLAIALAVMHDPELFILDEPINGLDPIGIAEVRSFIRELCDARGKTIFISSHILSEIALLADDIGIIDHGVLLEEESLAELAQKSGRYVLFTLSDTAQAAKILERAFPGIRFSIQDSHTLRLHDPALPAGKMVTAFVKHGLEVSEAHTCEESLEDYFKRVTGGEGIA